jgi:hypothetical protein
MTYHPLTRESGGDADSRKAEARQLLDMLRPYYDDMPAAHQKFWTDMQERYVVTVKQLFFLRDLKDRYTR